MFRKLFIPTLFGSLSICAVTAIDGIFVGQGTGSDGVAAVNIVVPLWMLFSGLELMVGSGCSVVAALHLSKGNEKAARLNVAQALLFTLAVTVVGCSLIMLMPEEVARMLGASDSLMPQVLDYMLYITPCFLFQVWSTIGLFIIRLDGAPKVAMWCNVANAVTNAVLDWVFIFPLGMGVKGAAIASTLSTVVGGVMAVSYILLSAKTLTLYRIRMSMKSMALTVRNIAYQCKIGFPALFSEVTMAMLMFIGNQVFMEYLGDAGVGAFGVACYYLPFVFMFGNAIAESAQPIVSFNYGLGRKDRVAEALAISCRTAVVGSLLSIVAFTMFPGQLVGLFIPTTETAAQIAVSGFPYFAIGFLFFILNLVAVGYFQSIERAKPAIIFALLRGVIFMIPCFMLLPGALGVKGIWLAMPLSEIATFVMVVAYFVTYRKKVL